MRRVHRLVRPDQLFVTRSVSQLSQVARWIVRRGFDVVLCGGGDGTFAQCVTQIDAQRGHTTPLPAFGLLPLGTGNALADTLGARPCSTEGLRQTLEHARSWNARRQISLLRIDGHLVPFAGFGADALILRDLNRVRRRLKHTPLSFLARGLLGYLTALTTRSLLGLLLRQPPCITIRNEGHAAWGIDLQGQRQGRLVAPGAVLYHGPAHLAAASTIPQYGFGFRLFPQAQFLAQRSAPRPRFQLRVINTSVLSMLLRLPDLCRGTLVHPGVQDFACRAISIGTSRPTPFQLAGDEAIAHQPLCITMAQIDVVCRPT